jgi:glycine cleavage system H protein
VEEGEACAVVESVKAASDVYAPLAGRVTETNQAIVEDPSLVNREPAGEGWFFKLDVNDPARFQTLMDEGEYQALVETL